MKLPPLGTLRAFDAAMRHCSFSRAGDELHLTHGAVSRQVAQLEAALGVALFRRHARGVEPTAAGRRFHLVVADVLSRLGTAAAGLKRRGGGAVVRVGVLPSFAAHWLLPRLEGFRGLRPDIEVQIVSDRRLADLTRGGIDLAVRYGLGRWPQLDAELLMQERLFPVARPDPSLPALTAAVDLAGRTLLHDERHDGWSDWLAAVGWPLPRRRRDVTHDDYNLVVAAALDGQGIAMGRSRLVARDLAAGRLARLSPVEVLNSRAYYLVAPPRRLSAAAAAFRAWLVQAAGGADT